MNVIKRDGSESVFDAKKIMNAILGVNNDLSDSDKIDATSAEEMTNLIVNACTAYNRALNVEEIQDIVERTLMKHGRHEAAKQYVLYRYKRALARQKNTTDDKIISLIDSFNEEIKQENSNKNPAQASTQRDYMAGEVSKDISKRLLLPKEVVNAHNEGSIWFHDMDYYAQHIFNCCLVNLEDMLQNGTVISGNMIESPKSFLTACTVASQIAAAVSSGQYGGQTMSLAHLAPFVDVSRKKYIKQIKEELGGVYVSNDKIAEMAEIRTRREVKAGIQTLAYQLCTIRCSNGQAPFISFFMYLKEAKNEQEKKDLALIIEEVLNQRIEGMKNEVGIPVTPAFPKLLFCIDTNTCDENAPYWYLTELAAKCTAKRLVPDYISEKMMLRDKLDPNGIGHVYPCINILCLMCKSA